MSKLFVAPLPERANDGGKIRKVLVANRGEIACRVIRTCRLLRITTVAIYVEEDFSSRHIVEADVAINIGRLSARETNPYLDSRCILDAALGAGVDAVHPGYGYLSENADFADDIRNAGLIFIGPDRLALSTLGNKRAAKEYLAREAPDVPLIPGYKGTSQTLEDLTTAAKLIGYPVMIKASAGGGGKGLRIAYNTTELKSALQRAQSESSRSFGSSDCILEKCIAAGKHVEMQMVGDRFGNIVCFFERDCSVQRRNQKIIEESPCSWLSTDLRSRMKKAATRIMEIIRYEGAGTVEFMVDIDRHEFYFLEVNARLQVEHPITEEVTGVDLVALQLFVASGGNLADLPQLRDLQQVGHAIECRLCAENPMKNFGPEGGVIQAWNPSSDRELRSRFETSICPGTKVTVHFDPLLAKIIVWAPTRPKAINDMLRVVSKTICIGVKTNQLFLQACLSHIDFHDPSYTTSFISKNLDALLLNPYLIAEPKMISAMYIIPACYQYAVTLSGMRQRRGLGTSTLINSSQHNSLSARGMIVSMVDDTKLSNQNSWLILKDHGSEGLSGQVTMHAQSLNEITSSPAGSIAAYNALSNAVRSGAAQNWTHYNITNIDSKTVECKMPLHGLTMNINNLKIEVWIIDKMATPNIEDVSLLCHYPALGTWYEYRCRGLLQYFSTEGIELKDSRTDERNIKAPMPCKVISILKKNGDQVTPGEAIVVIESMKMETTVTTEVAGTFETTVKEGGFVDDGHTLCNIV